MRARVILGLSHLPGLDMRGMERLAGELGECSQLTCLPPLVGKHLGKSALGMRADAFEQVAQISERVDAESLRSREEAAQHGCCPSAVVAAEECPISPTNRDSGRFLSAPLLSISKSPSSQ